MNTGVAMDLSWSRVQEHIEAIAGRIRADGVPEVIVGIVRGGVIPAVMLAHTLGVRDVRTVRISHTLGDLVGSAKTLCPQVYNPQSLGVLDSAVDVLLIDDVAGSGATLESAARLLTGVRRVRRVVVAVNTINWRRVNACAAREAVDYIGCVSGGWVRLPWEVR